MDIKKKIEDLFNKKGVFKYDYEFEDEIIKIYNNSNDDIEAKKYIAKIILGLEYHGKHEFSYELRGWVIVWLSQVIGSEMLKYVEKELTESEKEKFDELYWEFIDVLWMYKMVVSEIPKSLISLERIEEINMEMKLNYEWLNLSLAPYYKALMEQKLLLGDLEAAKENYNLWKNTENDGMEDCPACSLDNDVQYHYYMKDYAKALELSKDLISRELSCESVPEVTYKYVLNSYINLRKYSETEKLFPKALKDIEKYYKEFNDATKFIDLIEILIRLEKFNEAIKIAKKYQKEIERTVDRYYFMRYVIATAPINDWSKENAVNIVREFDKRNGNNYYENYLNSYLTSVYKYN